MTEQELLNQNNDTFRDEGSDAWKLKGKIRSAEVRAFHLSIIAWVKRLLPEGFLTSSDVSTNINDTEQDAKLITQGQAKTLGGVSFTPITENQAGTTHPAFNSQHDLYMYLLSNGTYTPTEPTSDGPSVISPSATNITDTSMQLSWTNPTT